MKPVSQLNESDLWEGCWQRLSTVFNGVADSLRRCNPQISAQSGHRQSTLGPFDAWIELARVEGPARTEDVVVFAGVKRRG